MGVRAYATQAQAPKTLTLDELRWLRDTMHNGSWGAMLKELRRRLARGDVSPHTKQTIKHDILQIEQYIAHG